MNAQELLDNVITPRDIAELIESGVLEALNAPTAQDLIDECAVNDALDVYDEAERRCLIHEHHMEEAYAGLI